jgi:hypothetical protein
MRDAVLAATIVASSEAQIDTAANAMTRDAVVLATNAARPAAPSQPRTITTTWLELSGPRMPAKSAARAPERPRGERMTMSMLPWITPSPERVVEQTIPARMTMTRQVATARTTIGRQR